MYCVPPSFRALFTATDLSESISRQKKKEMEQEEEGRDGGTAPPEKWWVHPGKGVGLSFSEEGKDGGTEGTTEVEMGPKLVPPPFPPRSVGWAYKRANRVLAKRLRSASSRVFCSVRLFPEKCFPPNFVSWPVWEPVLRKGSWGRLNETAMQRPLLTDLKCKFMKEGTNLVLDLVGLVESGSR